MITRFAISYYDMPGPKDARKNATYGVMVDSSNRIANASRRMYFLTAFGVQASACLFWISPEKESTPKRSRRFTRRRFEGLLCVSKELFVRWLSSSSRSDCFHSAVANRLRWPRQGAEVEFERRKLEVL